MYPHLLHHLVEEVFSLGVGAGGEDGLEVVQEGEDVRPVEAWEAEALRLRVEVDPSGTLGAPSSNSVLAVIDRS